MQCLCVLILLVGSAVVCDGVTDQEFQELRNIVHELRLENKRQSAINDALWNTIGNPEDGRCSCYLGDVNGNTILVCLVQGTIPKPAGMDVSDQDINGNASIEERVSFLEVQVSSLDEDVDFLFDQQLIQDERLLSLEQEDIEVNEQLGEANDNIQALQGTTLALDYRVTSLEENGGGDGISELEERMETLEGTAEDHDTRLNEAENKLSDLQDTTDTIDSRVTIVETVVDDLETRLTGAEENIEALETEDLELEARITVLEENGSGDNETIAFSAVLTRYTSIPDEGTVEFNKVITNEGNGYDSSTGVFTVPSGGDGFYYFYIYLLVDSGEYAIFDVVVNKDDRMNDEVLVCTAEGDLNANGYSDFPHTTCGAVVYLTEGEEVKVIYKDGLNTTPLSESTIYYQNGFTGFRI